MPVVSDEPVNGCGHGRTKWIRLPTDWLIKSCLDCGGQLRVDTAEPRETFIADSVCNCEPDAFTEEGVPQWYNKS